MRSAKRRRESGDLKDQADESEKSNDASKNAPNQAFIILAKNYRIQVLLLISCRAACSSRTDLLVELPSPYLSLVL